MIYNTIFTSSQVNTALNGGNALDSGNIATNNAVSWCLINNSPFYLDMFDQNGNVIAEVAPWSNTQDSFDHEVIIVEIKQNTSLPTVNFQGNTLFGVKLGFTSATLVPQSSNTIEVSNVNAQTANVNIIGTPNVNVANTPSVNATINGTANVNVANTPTVQVSSGTVNIGNTPSVNIANTPSVTGTVNIGNSAINVQNVPNGSLTVAGTVSIGNTPSVSISGTPTVAIAANQQVNIANTPSVNIANTPSVNATISGTANVNIANTPTVSIASGNVNATIQNASINSKVLNQMLAQNNLVLIASGTISVSNLANGSYQAINTDCLSQSSGGSSFLNSLGSYDGLLIAVTTTNGINWGANGFPINPTGLCAHYLDIVFPNLINNTIASAGRVAKIVRQIQMPNGGANALLLWYNESYVFNVATAAIQNNSGSTISSDTLTVYYYGIKSIQPGDRGGSYTTSTGVFTLNNGAYTIIFINGNYNTVLLKVFLGTNVAVTNNFYLSMGPNTSNQQPIMNLNTAIQTSTYDLTPGVIIPPNYIVCAYQSSGSQITAEITLLVD